MIQDYFGRNKVRVQKAQSVKTIRRKIHAKIEISVKLTVRGKYSTSQKRQYVLTRRWRNPFKSENYPNGLEQNNNNFLLPLLKNHHALSSRQVKSLM